MKYRQCRLEREVPGGVSHLVSFIPAKFAVVDKVLKLKNEKDEWEDGWKVLSCGELVDEDLLPDYRKEIRNHRKMTGDSLRRGA